MAVHVDFTVSADELVWKSHEELTFAVAGKKFTTPDHFYESTLVLFLNGQRLENVSSDLFTIVDEETVEMVNTYPFPRFRISVGYVKKEI